MTRIILAYDIKKTTDTIHEELKNELMITFNYSDQIQSAAEPTMGRWYDLPNTTLTKTGITCKEASEEFLKACLKTGAQWERYIAVESINSVFNSRKL